MNVLMINGSPKPNGNTAIALREMDADFCPGGHPDGDRPRGQ